MLHQRFAYGLFVLLILCFFSPLASSQQLAFTVYDRSSGLPSDYILCMYQDREGFMWFGTDRGVSRYDGTAFITFTVADGLGSNFVRRIFQDEGGTMWFGLIEGGVTAFDGSSFNTYTMKDGLNSDNVLNINQDRSGRMYFKTDRGVSILSGGRFVHSSVGAVSLRVFDLLGRQVATLVNDHLPPGRYKTTWDASGMPSGVYFCRIQSLGFMQTRKLILNK
jgi:ligand-binding sensor domain-containing protein